MSMAEKNIRCIVNYMETSERQSRKIHIGSVPVGGNAPVTVQSMTNTRTEDVEATLNQIKKLAAYGCDIIRIAVPDRRASERISEIVNGSPIPVVADIHFDYRLALSSIKAGVHGIRINPGNIGDEKALKAVASALLESGISVRVGANSGSLPEKFRNLKKNDPAKKDENLADALVMSALEQCNLLEKYAVKNIKVSLKASDVRSTVMAYRKFAKIADYPLHLGITEAGTPRRGIIKSAVGIGALLLDGIGDTIRVSLTADPLEEVKVGIQILESAGLRTPHPEIVSCPTCGRTEIDLLGLAERIENEIERIKSSGRSINLAKIAVMGCVVNGPGEASDADLGIAGGKGRASIFSKGKLIRTVPENEILEVFLEELDNFIY